MKELGLYVHIPFCVSKCKYCNFNSYSDKGEHIVQYLSALCKEIKQSATKSNGYQVTTIFIGGGTPSVLHDGMISTILSEIRKYYNISDTAEVTIEANPNTITYAKASEWYMAGVNRVSVGLQSDKKNVLRAIGRTHTRADYINVMRTLKRVGFTNINTDLMIGLPTQKQSYVKSSINLAKALGSTHISCYSLILEDNTLLFNEVQAGKVKLPPETKTLNMYNFAYMYLKKIGYNRYEVSNFAKSGYECKHNLNTWSMAEYLGFGAGAHSYFNGHRFGNVQDICEYIDAVAKGETKEFDESISKAEELEETIMLGLRKVEGINLTEINQKFDIDFSESKANQISKLTDLGLIKIENNRLFATDYGFCLLNKVILDLV